MGNRQHRDESWSTEKATEIVCERDVSISPEQSTFSL